MSNTNNQQVKNQVQTLIVPEKQQDNYIELGMKCVTPGLPRERLDEETQKQVEQVVQQQSIEIMKLSHNENNEKENLESISEESDPNDKQHQPEMPTKINTESQASLKRGRVPAALDLQNQPDFFTKKLKFDNSTIQTATSEGNKPNVSIKYVGYNETPQYMAGGYSAGGYYNYPGYYPNEYIMMQQQYLLQMSYMNQNAYAQGYQPEQMMGNGYPSYITPLTNQMQYNPVVYQPVYQHPEVPQTGLGIQQKGPAPINDQEEDEEDVEVDEEKEEVEEEDGEKGMEFKGIISINNDSFKFEFKTENEETVGKLQTEINNLNREKFLRICEKTWNESYWLMKKREQFSNSTSTGLSAEIEVSHHGDEDEDEEDDEYYEEDDEQEEDYEEEEEEPAQHDENDDEDYEEEDEEPAQDDDNDDEDYEEEEEEPAQDDDEEDDEDPEASEESKSDPVIESEGEAEEEAESEEEETKT